MALTVAIGSLITLFERCRACFLSCPHDLCAAQTGIEMIRAIPDLVLMSELSENEMFKVLSTRLKDKRIYTYIGDVLISVNPYTQLPIYGQERINEHKV